MIKHVVNRLKPTPVTDDSAASTEEQQLEQVRSVLLAPQTAIIADLKKQIEVLEHRITDPELRAHDTSEILQSALSKSNEKEDWFAGTLKPMVVKNFQESSREDPEIMAEALFPILGPAVRKMIANLISPDKNRPKAGYRIEQLFLIDKNTGLPVCHVASDHAETQDADMVSGMLSAIQSFVHDAFQTDEFDGLNTLEVGELSVWIEWGPQAVLAAVVRGAPPKKLREALQIKIETIQQDYKKELTNYQGDTEAFNSLKPDLYLFLDKHDGSVKSQVKNLSAVAKRNSLIALAVLSILTIMLVRGWIEDARWGDFIADLQAQPGIVISGEAKLDDSYHVYGLRDPLAIDPEAVLEKSNTARDVTFHLEPYNALQPAFVQQRAIKMLKPGTGVNVSLIEGTLYVSGQANLEWITKAKPIANAIAGVSAISFNVRQMEDEQ